MNGLSVSQADTRPASSSDASAEQCFPWVLGCWLRQYGGWCAVTSQRVPPPLPPYSLCLQPSADTAGWGRPGPSSSVCLAKWAINPTALRWVTRAKSNIGSGIKAQMPLKVQSLRSARNFSSAAAAASPPDTFCFF